MSEGFFARWSHRKLQAAKQREQQQAEGERALPAPEPPVTSQGDQQAVAAPVADDRNVEGQQCALDPATLPPIDSLGPDSDFRIFLQAGVPAELARAALRHAWTSDPKIRDYVGLAENAWDFTAPDGAPGFASLAPADASRLMAHLSGKVQAAVQQAAGQIVANPLVERAHEAPSGADLPAPNMAAMAATTENQPAPSNEIATKTPREDTVRQISSEERDPHRPVRRHHGRALPQ